MYAQMMTLVNMIENNAPANPNISDVFSAFAAVKAAEKAIQDGVLLDI